MPEGVCATAWSCIYWYVFALANGGYKNGFFFGNWANSPCMAISNCNDRLRPDIFKLESNRYTGFIVKPLIFNSISNVLG